MKIFGKVVEIFFFYNIFKNAIKHLKIFFRVFLGMQPNTWKYFFSKNIILVF